MTLNAAVHWKDERLPGPPEFDFTTDVTLTRTPPEDDHYIGGKNIGEFRVEHWCNFTIIEGKCRVVTRIIKSVDWFYWSYPNQIFNFDITQPFDPPIFRVFSSPWGTTMWCDTKLTAP